MSGVKSVRKDNSGKNIWMSGSVLDKYAKLFDQIKSKNTSK
jgi:hypothetical protein